MITTSYAVRDADGSTSYGQLEGANIATLNVTPVADVSLNIQASDVRAYERHGTDLHVLLSNGETIVLQGFFEGGAERDLYLSSDGAIVEVHITPGEGDSLFAQYEALDVNDKWSAYDDLVFLDLDKIEPVVAPLIAPLFGGLGGAAAVGGAAIVGGALLGGGGDGAGGNNGENGGGEGEGGGTGGGEGGPATPTVNDVDVPRIIGGTADTDLTVSGTGEPGATVTVVVGEATGQGTIGDDGTWSVVFGPDDLPEDGDYTTTVTVTNPDGSQVDLTGPVVDIDTTPPELAITSGTGSTGDTLNGAEHDAGATIAGTGEAGATVTVTIEGESQTTTVGADGTWSVTFGSSQIATGEFITSIAVTATDARGNVTMLDDTLVVDTIAPAITIAPVEGDDVVNAAEQSDGVTVTGTSEAGASLSVTLAGVTRTVTADASGNWQVSYSATELPAGTYDATLDVTATDAAGNSSSSSSTIHVDTETGVTLAQGAGGSDGVVNMAEATAGITLTGTAEAGASVVVSVAGVTRSTTADGNGNWTVTYQGGSLPTGEYDAAVTVTATDAAGNVASTNDTLAIDTRAPALNIGTVEGDNAVNAAEHADGVTITGTAEAGARVEVTLEGVTRVVTADAGGNWSTTYTTAEVPAGTYTSTLSVTATDAAGNTSSASSSILVDTETVLTLAPGAGGADGVINKVESAAGLALNGTAEAGASVVVKLAGVSHSTTADANGNWSVHFASGEIATNGNIAYTAPIVVTSTDTLGNTATVNSSVRVDTGVTNLSIALNQTGDDIINANEAAGGFQLTGTTEIGSTLTVKIDGVSYTATVDGNGNWTVAVPGGVLDGGTYSEVAVVKAIDAAGNTKSINYTFLVDTEIDTPGIDSVTYTGESVRRISTFSSTDSFDVHTLSADGTIGSPTYTESNDPVFGNEFTFASPVPDGTHLVVSASDLAGNSSGTLVVMADNATNVGTIDNPGLASFTIGAIELEYASDTSLVLTEAKIRDLIGSGDTLTVHGGTDDTLNIAGAVQTSEVRDINGQAYDVYTLGDAGMKLLIEQDINVVI